MRENVAATDHKTVLKTGEKSGTVEIKSELATTVTRHAEMVRDLSLEEWQRRGRPRTYPKMKFQESMKGIEKVEIVLENLAK